VSPLLSRGERPRPETARGTFKLRFTGSCDAAEFERLCSTHEYWYHSYYFDNGFERRGDYDIGQTIESYGFPELEGLDVLDIGTGSGWFATYFEQQGANVTTVDVRGMADYDLWGRYSYDDISVEKPAPDRLDEGRPVYTSPVSGGFWVMKDILGLRARYLNARVYDIAPELFDGRTFDLVFMGAVLMHVRDPLRAMMAARSVCRGLFVANSVEPSVESPLPIMEFLNDEHRILAWWAQNRACLDVMARSVGFQEVDVTGSVDLVVDQPYVTPDGIVAAMARTLPLLHARV
jgi:2-polyprenyl-3-methyl-5-hydroxy-6-metoxy-1,4-benzoquinol methylase